MFDESRKDDHETTSDESTIGGERDTSGRVGSDPSGNFEPGTPPLTSEVAPDMPTAEGSGARMGDVSGMRAEPDRLTDFNPTMTRPQDREAKDAANPGGRGDAPPKPPRPHYEPDAFTLLGDVIQTPVKAFAYLGLHRAERIGLAVIVYVFSQIPSNWFRNPLGMPADAPLGRIAGNIITSLIGLAVGVAFLHLFARILGGRNKYLKLFQALGFAALPNLLAAPFLLLDPSLAVGGLALSASGIWSFVLGVIAVREVYGFSTARALGAVFLPVIVTIALGIGLAALAAVMGLVFMPELQGLF